MSIILMGGDFSQFSGSYGYTTSVNYYNTAYSKWAVGPTRSSPPTAAFIGGATPSEWWLHCVYSLDDGYYADYNIITFRASGADIYALRTITTNNTMVLAIYNGSSWDVIPETTFTTVDDTPYVFDIHFAPDGTTGVVEMFVNGALVGSVTGNYIAAAGATIDEVRFSSHYLNDSRRCWLSEVIMTDGDNTLGWHVSTLMPVGVGTTGDWTGAYTDIDEAGAVNTADYIESDTDTNLSIFEFGDLHTSLDSDLVKTVFLYANVEKITGSAVTNIDLVTRPASTNYTGGNSGALTDDTPTDTHAEFSTNPETASAWTLSAVNSAEFGFRANT